MKRLFKRLATTNISTAYIFILLGISTLMMAGYFSYAWFTVQGVQKYSVVTGNLYGTVAIGRNSVTIAGQGVLTYTPTTDSDTITLTVTNTNDRTVKNSIYYYNLSDSTIQIGYTSDSPTIPSTAGVSVAQNNTLTYKIKINNAKGKQIKIGSSIGLSNSNLTLPSGTTAFALLSDPTGAETLVAQANPEDLDYNTATDDQKNQMWTFTHEATEQLKATTDYRYIGKNPNNYVKFNDELWRIIGVFDTDDGTGKIEKRLKIMRNEYSGSYAFNTSNWNSSVGSGILNDNYYNSLKDIAKEMMADAKWYLGGVGDFTESSNGLTSHFYKYERGTSVFNSNIYSTNWIGKIGLIYPSDYGYATSGGNSVNKNNCMLKEIYNWDSDCKNNDWLLKMSMGMITHQTSSSQALFGVNYLGYFSYYNTNYKMKVYPTVYLKSTINITSGTGSSTDPFILG